MTHSRSPPSSFLANFLGVSEIRDEEGMQMAPKFGKLRGSTMSSEAFSGVRPDGYEERTCSAYDAVR
jgi:hypothetical protein